MISSKRLEGTWYILFDFCVRAHEKKARAREREREMAFACLLACFNVLNLKGASGTYQVETRILCAHLFGTLKINTVIQRHKGWMGRQGAAPNNLLQKHLFWGKPVPDTACTRTHTAEEPDGVCTASQARINNVKEYLRQKNWNVCLQ